MSTIAYEWFTERKPPEPNVYMTRKRGSRHLTVRYWDGGRWWQIEWCSGRARGSFKWPKRARVRFPVGLSCYRESMGLRAINQGQSEIQWGEPYKVYDDREVLAFLVKSGRLPADWRECFQGEMRIANA